MKKTIITLALLLLCATVHAQEEGHCVRRATRGIPSSGTGSGSPPTEKGVTAYRWKDVDRKAIITQKPQPSYTDEARGNGVEGVVRLRAVLCPLGDVLDITVEKSLPDGLTEASIAAARGIKFKPATRKGLKVAQFVTLEYYFKL